ncbi:sialomucin core protein 24 [Hoplias malabaricus]|uniref:sialomucin core protein 24 n=1 Tax=Hoplias malabaricus TaxID=27720 RepID=UPI00346201B5
MYWRGFFLILVLTALSSSFQETSGDGACDNLTCEECSNMTGCFWMDCNTTVRCVNSSFATENNCTNATCHSTPTTVSPMANTTATNATTVVTTATQHTTLTTTVAPTHNSTSPNSTTTTAPPTPKKKSTFDAASFIGGIVLVLGFQAVVFFLYKFCKSKDRNYHTL